MSWSYYRQGQKDALLADIQSVKSSSDESSWQEAKAFLIQQIEACPQPFVKIEASGHSDLNNHTCSIKIETIHLLMPEAKPVEHAAGEAEAVSP